MQEDSFKSPKSRRLFEFLKDAYVKDDEVLRVPLEKCGWRSLVQIAEGTGFAPNSLYGKRPGHVGPDLQELITDRLIEMRYFEGERGRGGEVMRFRIVHPKNVPPSKILQPQKLEPENFVQSRVPPHVEIGNVSYSERRLAAIMFTDMVGYAAIGQRDESLSLALIEESSKLLLPVFQRHNGRLVKTLGDSFLVEFPNALEAVRCGYDVQRVVREFNIAQPVEKRLNLRIGIHLGDVVESGGDIFGDAVNIASRVEPFAESGGVCLTRQVYDQVRNKIDLTFTSLGERLFKNVELPIELYKVDLPWSETKEEESLGLDRNRIAILPFTNMSPDPNDEYFADGMTDEIISTVSKLERVEVISRTSVMQYKRNPKSIREVTKELNVGTILEGSVRKAGNRLRITAQLIDATKDRHLWAETYDRNLEDVFAVQSEVAEKVANALQVSAHKPESIESINNIEAYTMYLRAMQFSQEYSESSYRKAIALFEGAISKDPTLSRAYVGLANAWIMMGAWLTGWADFTSSVNKAEAAVKRALELDPESAYAHAVMGRVHLTLDRFDEARLELQRAIEINPNLASANESLGVEYATMGRFDEAIKYVQKACYLDPLNPHPMRIMTNVLRVEGKVDEALEIVGNFMEIFPRDLLAYLQRVLCFLQKKDLSRASEALDAGLSFYPDDYWLRIVRGMTFVLAGRRGDAMGELRRLMTDEAESNRLGAQVWIRTALGDLDEAFEALMREAEHHSWWFLIKFDPLFERLWKDPRFSAFCKKVGI